MCARVDDYLEMFFAHSASKHWFIDKGRHILAIAHSDSLDLVSLSRVACRYVNAISILTLAVVILETLERHGCSLPPQRQVRPHHTQPAAFLLSPLSCRLTCCDCKYLSQDRFFF